MTQDPYLAAVIDEFERERIGVLLIEILDMVVIAVCATNAYPPAYYSETGSWNQSGFDGVRNGWIVERLWKPSGLEHMLRKISAREDATLDDLRPQLRVSLKSYMGTLRGEREGRNLWLRVRVIVTESEAITTAGSGGEMLCAIDGDTGKVSKLDERALEAITNRLDDETLNLRRILKGSKATSPINDADLEHLIEYVLQNSNGAVRLRSLNTAIRRRLSVPEVASKTVDDYDEILDGPADTESEALHALEADAISLVVESTFARVKPAEAVAVVALRREGNFAAAGASIGENETTTRNRCKRTALKLVEDLESAGLIGKCSAKDRQTAEFDTTTLINKAFEALIEKLEKEYGLE